VRAARIDVGKADNVGAAERRLLLWRVGRFSVQSKWPLATAKQHRETLEPKRVYAIIGVNNAAAILARNTPLSDLQSLRCYPCSLTVHSFYS
jgi:hypothetical protein